MAAATSTRSSTTRRARGPLQADATADAEAMSSRVVLGRFSRNWMTSAPPSSASVASSACV